MGTPRRTFLKAVCTSGVAVCLPFSVVDSREKRVTLIHLEGAWDLLAGIETGGLQAAAMDRALTAQPNVFANRLGAWWEHAQVHRGLVAAGLNLGAGRATLESVRVTARHRFRAPAGAHWTGETLAPALERVRQTLDVQDPRQPWRLVMTAEAALSGKGCLTERGLGSTQAIVAWGSDLVPGKLGHANPEDLRPQPDAPAWTTVLRQVVLA